MQIEEIKHGKREKYIDKGVTDISTGKKMWCYYKGRKKGKINLENEKDKKEQIKWGR